jgi:hypothetical protein
MYKIILFLVLSTAHISNIHAAGAVILIAQKEAMDKAEAARMAADSADTESALAHAETLMEAALAVRIRNAGVEKAREAARESIARAYDRARARAAMAGASAREAARVQAAATAEAARLSAAEAARLAAAEAARVQAAATKIQSFTRGRNARTAVAGLKRTAAAERAAAAQAVADRATAEAARAAAATEAARLAAEEAARVQAAEAARAAAARAEEDGKTAAATAIQARFRGRNARTAVAGLKRTAAAERAAAAQAVADRAAGTIGGDASLSSASSTASAISGEALSGRSAISIETIRGYATQAEDLAAALESTNVGVENNSNIGGRRAMVGGMAQYRVQIEELKLQTIAAGRGLSGSERDAVDQAVARIEAASGRAKAAYRAAAEAASPDLSRMVSISSPAAPIGRGTQAAATATASAVAAPQARLAPRIYQSGDFKGNPPIKSTFIPSMANLIIATKGDLAYASSENYKWAVQSIAQETGLQESQIIEVEAFANGRSSADKQIYAPLLQKNPTY